MAKVLAALFIACAFAWGGRFAASLDSKRTELIRSILLMINIIETRLRFCAVPVAELLRLLEESECSHLPFISKCRLAVENGEPFGAAWKACISECRSFCRLIPEESAKLIAMGSDIGVTDIEGQLSCCNYYREIFFAYLSEREEKSRRSARLFPPLGMLLGVSAVLFIV